MKKWNLLFAMGWLSISSLGLYAQNTGKTSIARKTVLFEMGTSIGCGNCTSVAQAMDSLVVNGKNASVIKYQMNDLFENTDSDDRIAYYGITANPTLYIDGKERIVTGGYQVNLYPEFLEKYETYIQQESYMDMSMEITHQTDRDFHIIVAVKQLEQIFDTKLNLRLAMIESHIEHEWFYLDEVNFVCREMIPSAKGYELDFTKDSTLYFDIDFTMDTAYNINNSSIVGFVQHDGSQEILQAVKASFPEITAINEFSEDMGIQLYPNPVSDELKITSEKKITGVKIINSLGASVMHLKTNNVTATNLWIGNLPKGVYYVMVIVQQKKTVLKFIK